jgi:AraC-like DNA-binding protein
MMKADVLLESQDPTFAIEKEVMYLDSLKEVERLSTDASVKMEYNAIVHCRRGVVQLEIGGKEQVRVQAGKLLLVPTHKLLQPMMVSTDVDVAILLISDRVLKRVLGPQMEIWNRAMYLKETYVIDGRRWTEALKSYSRGVFRGEELQLFNDIVLAFLRVLLLIICEELLHTERLPQFNHISTDRDKTLFQQFLYLISHEQQKRQQVNYYAEKLFITPKYLSTVCRKVSGRSPIRWITDSVMEDSYQLLRTTDLTVKEISNKLGFPNSSFFGQYFREHAGTTPIEYRTKNAM